MAEAAMFSDGKIAALQAVLDTCAGGIRYEAMQAHLDAQHASVAEFSTNQSG